MTTWQRSYTQRLTTVESVDAEIDRCQDELWAAQRLGENMAGWENKLDFLKGLRGRVTTPELPLQ